jgi:S1-C subfamily serine protease
MPPTRALCALSTLGLLAGAPSALAQPAGAPQFQLVNRTGSVATAVNAVRSGSQGWGRNLIEGRGLRPGQVLNISATAEAGCIFDLRLVLIDRPPIERRRQDICNTSRIEFTAQDAAAPGGLAGKPPPGAGVGIETDPNAPGPAPPGGQQFAGPAPGAAPQPAPAPRGGSSSGTGFIVAEGRALTNSHVVEQCSRIVARNSAGRELPAQVTARDTALDLAVLTLARDAGPALSFRDPPVVRRGDEVVTYGFPLSGILSSGPTLTRGDISALAGLRDDQNQLQISAPVQRGNSGGPLLDRSGNVVGVVVSKLNAQRVAERTGDIPQNVNFAIKGERAIAFLRRNGVTPRLSASVGERPAAEVGDIAHPSTLFLQCFR